MHEGSRPPLTPFLKGFITARGSGAAAQATAVPWEREGKVLPCSQTPLEPSHQEGGFVPAPELWG